MLGAIAMLADSISQLLYFTDQIVPGELFEIFIHVSLLRLLCEFANLVTYESIELNPILPLSSNNRQRFGRNARRSPDPALQFQPNPSR
jgi:hypothetical protein